MSTDAELAEWWLRENAVEIQFDPTDERVRVKLTALLKATRAAGVELAVTTGRTADCILCGGCGLAVASEAMVKANDPAVTLDGYATSWPCPACYPRATQHKSVSKETK